MLDAASKKRFDEAFKILFCGDLILLEDQVKNAFDGESYDFNPMFEYTRRYIQAAALSIGVFEVPCDGTRRDYSQSNFNDGVGLYLNFPDTFADAVKNAGFDLVTLATNHVLDMGDDGIKRTVDVLNQKNLPHIGAYVSSEDKSARKIKIVEKDGIKFAILAYTATVNGYTREHFTEGKHEHVTSILVLGNSPKYQQVLEGVRKDFELAKKHNPDLIVVLPHWGIQFTDNPSAFQQMWRKTFLECGADIILGDHTHTVQPAILSTVNGRKTYTLYCPGNYANIYREHNGDATAMVEIYIDRSTKKIIGSSIIPMWTQSPLRGNYRALPIFDIVNDPKLGREISTRDMGCVEFIHKHITRVMLGSELDLNFVQEKYYQDEAGFMRNETEPLELTDAMRSGEFYRLLTSVENVCFIGDSITVGSRNGGVPWYEPIEHLIKGKAINHAWDSCTTKRILKDHLEEVLSAEAELFVIALGTNDVRYRNSSICAMQPSDYTARLMDLRSAIWLKHQSAKFVFIAPWRSTKGDRISKLNYKDRTKMYEEYTRELSAMCFENDDTFLDPTEYIGERLRVEPRSKYMRDAIHPNATEGVRLYSEAVMLC